MKDMDFEEPTQLEFHFRCDGHDRQLDIIINAAQTKVGFIVMAENGSKVTVDHLRYILEEGLKAFDFHYTPRGDSCPMN